MEPIVDVLLAIGLSLVGISAYMIMTGRDRLCKFRIIGGVGSLFLILSFIAAWIT